MKYLLLLFFFLFMNKSKALTYDVWLEDKVDDINLVYETKTMYKWYKEEKKGEYLLYDISLDKYPYNDFNDFIYGNYSKWEDSCIETNYREIKYKNIYRYREIKKIKYIKLRNIGKSTKLNEIIIKSNNELINYKVISNNELYSDYYFQTEGYVILELDNYYDLNNLLIKINSDNYYRLFKVYLYADLNNNYIGFSEGIFTNFNNYVNKNWIDINNEKIYTDILESDKEIIKNDFNLVLDSYQMCSYRDILTYHYRIEKIYYDNNYHDYIEGYYKDLEDYKIYYKYDSNIGKNNDINNNINYLNNKIVSNNVLKLKVNQSNIETNNKNTNGIKYVIGLVIILSITYFVIKKCRLN